MGWRLADMHCHLDFMSNAPEVAQEARGLGLAVLACSVTPEGFLRAREELGDAPNVRLAVGAHPWWVADGRLNDEGVALTARLAGQEGFVGEIGMDLSPAHVDSGSKARQLAALERICTAAASAPTPGGRQRVLSLHSVRSAGAVLDVLERTGALERCACVFHWFSGTSDELHRAVGAGCWFSVNEMMLTTKRGREYARQLPEGRLLTETDLPPAGGEPFTAAGVASSLERTLGLLEQIRRRDVRDVCAANAQELLGL